MKLKCSFFCCPVIREMTYRKQHWQQLQKTVSILTCNNLNTCNLISKQILSCIHFFFFTSWVKEFGEDGLNMLLKHLVHCCNRWDMLLLPYMCVPLLKNDYSHAYIVQQMCMFSICFFSCVLHLHMIYRSMIAWCKKKTPYNPYFKIFS